ncbi:MAG: glycosyltransferase family 4 protein [Rhodocyclaceae bacterium]|nr:glycosyltransferase family 4 protein [Rhodocyclaceae bacterium]MCA3025099.1 glycosyltransferase family 4 protein [Rhodocyclaceae bacterium]MCA3038625.1 glycosyltransferase family 4 protein [Rhodocyclaceae bacterium]MCA3040046.1 glycosyltransferase family 4 protein [Rhodocyclaceae bacterium]MCA3047166.1 glycosyltransferase family 4 protein [Rhodocyclaceae bacterium]
MTIRALFLTRYDESGPSSRVRSIQFSDELRKHGVEAFFSPLLSKSYLEHRFRGSIYWPEVVKGYAMRVWQQLSQDSFDVYVVEKELFPWLPFWLERFFLPARAKLLIDYDDAVFHSYDIGSFIKRTLFSGKIGRLMQSARVVTVGNKCLAEYAEQWGCESVTLRSSVDCDRFHTSASEAQVGFTIGWIGSPITAKFLQEIREPLQWASQHLGARVLLVGSGNVDLGECRAEVVPWSLDTEVPLLQSIDIGVMPLTDSPFERGKCGYKLIQYMACGKPVIASPVGLNCEIVDSGVNGFLPKCADEWKAAFRTLFEDRQLAIRMGRAGRERVVKDYSVVATGAQLAQIIKNFDQKPVGHHY